MASRGRLSGGGGGLGFGLGVGFNGEEVGGKEGGRKRGERFFPGGESRKVLGCGLPCSRSAHKETWHCRGLSLDVPENSHLFEEPGGYPDGSNLDVSLVKASPSICCGAGANAWFNSGLFSLYTSTANH
eukprot:13656879-Heterocapsa_arctica.AAC.1